MSRDLGPVLPGKVQVCFRMRRCSGTVDQTPPRWYTKTVNLSDITLTDSSATAPTQSGGNTKTFLDSALAQAAGAGGTPTNQTALDDLAQQIAQDYYDWLSIGFDTAYYGVVAPDPTGLHDLISWEYSAGRVVTRERSKPLNADAEELCHQDGEHLAECQDTSNTAVPVAKTPGVEFYGPPAGCTSGGATATATLGGDAVASVTVTGGGSGYTSAPIVQFSQGDGSGATATATIGAIGTPQEGQVTGVTVTDGGSGYTRAPIVSFSGGGNKFCQTRYVLYLHDGRLWAIFVSTDCLG